MQIVKDAADQRVAVSNDKIVDIVQTGVHLTISYVGDSQRMITFATAQHASQAFDTLAMYVQEPNPMYFGWTPQANEE